MGQIVSSAAKPKRCNIQSLSSLGTPAAGEHILVSSDNSMNAAGQGNFDSYIVGDGTTAATALPLNKINADIIALIAEVQSNIEEKYTFPLTWVDNRLLRSNGGITSIDSSSTGYYNKCSTTDQTACTDYRGKTIKLHHGVTGNRTSIMFYNGNSGITGTYTEYNGDGVENVVVPADATSFRLCVYCNNTSLLSDSKAAAVADYSVFLLVKKEDIADNLTTDNSEKVLSAKQGKILNDSVTELRTDVDEIISGQTQRNDITFTWVDNRLLRSNGSTKDITSDQTAYWNRYATSNQISCADITGREITIDYGIENTYVAFYNSNGNLIGTSYTSFTGVGTANIQVPSNAVYMLVCTTVANSSNYSTAKDAVILYYITEKTEDNHIQRVDYSQKLFGAIDYAMPTDFDYSQLLFFGQSFAQGGSSAPVTTGVIPNCYMFGDHVKALTGSAFNPLQLRTDVSEPYEYPVVSCANALSRMYRRYTHDINIVASTAGSSGSSLQTLIQSYISNVVTMQTNMKSVADSENKSVGCFAIVFMQGESDYGGRENSTPDKDDYKALLLQTKNALQQSCMTNLGQDRKPLFFIYQTSGSWVKDYTGIDNSELGVSMAQIEFAQENDDVILISPAYQVTTYTDNHPSSNGYRWLGEMYAKAIWQTLYRGWRFSNPIPKEFVREDKRIIIYVSSCILPLKLDTWTLPRQTNYGFKVTADGTEVGITDIALENNAIVLTLGSSIAEATSVKVTYGGVGVGRGNICDSDTWSTWLKYLSDANDTGYDGNRVIGQSPTAEGGGSLVGQNYPMNNFLSIFYKELVSE